MTENLDGKHPNGAVSTVGDATDKESTQSIANTVTQYPPMSKIIIILLAIYIAMFLVALVGYK
jgi:hypothetical protein